MASAPGAQAALAPQEAAGALPRGPRQPVGGQAAGAYGLRSGVAATLGELGLSLDELVGLSRV